MLITKCISVCDVVVVYVLCAGCMCGVVGCVHDVCVVWSVACMMYVWCGRLRAWCLCVFPLQELIVLRAIRDANVPKFLQDDLKLFNGIVSDLFPRIKEEPMDYGEMEASIKKTCIDKGLEDVEGTYLTWGHMCKLDH